MGIIPDKKVEQVQFCESHAPIWTAGPAAIGLTAAQCTAFTTMTTNARKAYNDAQAAKQAYHAAVTNQNTVINTAINGLGGAADLIRVRARQQITRINVERDGWSSSSHRGTRWG